MRGLSGTASSGSAAAVVPSEVHMTSTSSGSLAGQPASADGSRIKAGGSWLGSLRISVGEPSFDAIVEGLSKQREEVGQILA
jgi:hypothetical protein